MKSYNTISLKDLPGACQVPESVSSPLSSPLSKGSETKSSFRFRRNRAFVKLSVGMTVNKLFYGQGRVFSLSESNEAVSEGLLFGEAAHKLFMAMRRRYGQSFDYAWVEHHPVAGKQYLSRKGEVSYSEGHYNRHVIVYGSGKLDAKWLGAEWERLYLSKVSGLSIVRSLKGLSFYLAAYLVKDDEEFVRIRFSQNWVFTGWFEFSKAFKFNVGRYPDVSMLAELKGQSRSGLRQMLRELKEVGYYRKS